MLIFGIVLFIISLSWFFVCDQPITLLKIFEKIIPLIIYGIIYGPLTLILLSVILILNIKQKNKTIHSIQVIQIFILLFSIVSVIFLPTMASVYCGPEPPKYIISNTISTNGMRGSNISNTFTLTDSIILTSQDFAEDGHDPESIFFAINQTLANGPLVNNFELVEGNDGGSKYSILSYRGETEFRGKARVACQETGEKLDETLNEVNIEYESHSNSATEYCEDVFPCCIVIIERA